MEYTLKRKILVNFIYGGIGLFNVVILNSLMKYFTDLVGLTPAMYGVVFLIFSIWNGINDPIIGFWADSRPFKTKKGKYRPLIQWSIPVIGLCSIAIFLASPNWEDIYTAIYLLVLLVVYEGAKALLDVSFNAFRVNAFISMKERTEVQVIGHYIAMVPIFVGGMIPIWFLTGDFSRELIVTIFSACIVVGLVMIFIGSLFVREDPKFYEHLETTKLRDLLKLTKDLLKDKTFLYFFIAVILITAAGNSFSGYLYYMDNVLNVSGLKATIPDLLTGFIQMAFFPFIVKLVGKYGSRNTYAAGLVIAVGSFILLALPVNYWVAGAAYVVMYAGFSFNSALMQPMQGLIIDELEINTGKRQPGMVMGIMAVLLTPASTIQPLILSMLLSASGYVGGVKEQTPEVVRAIRMGTGAIPAVMLVIGIVFLMMVPLNHKKELEIQHAMEKRHNQPEQE